MSKYVTFPIAKLLKEKGFTIGNCKEYFTDETISESNVPKDVFYEAVRKNKIISCLAPEIQDVIDWLLEKHGIWIKVECPDNLENNDWISYVYKVGRFECLYASHGIISPKEAYLAAIEYTLKNLI